MPVLGIKHVCPCYAYAAPWRWQRQSLAPTPTGFLCVCLSDSVAADWLNYEVPGFVLTILGVQQAFFALVQL